MGRSGNRSSGRRRPKAAQKLSDAVLRPLVVQQKAQCDDGGGDAPALAAVRCSLAFRTESAARIALEEFAQKHGRCSWAEYAAGLARGAGTQALPWAVADPEEPAPCRAGALLLEPEPGAWALGAASEDDADTAAPPSPPPVTPRGGVFVPPTPMPLIVPASLDGGTL